MLITDNLVFVHLHKSGGTFINQLLLRHGRYPRPIGYHFPYRMIPPTLRDLPVLGAIRDPLGYYVSWYHFQLRMRHPNPLFMICSDERQLDFASTIRNLIWLEADEARLRRFEDAVPDTFEGLGLNFTKQCVRDLRGSGLGFYSFLFHRMFQGADRCHFIPTERIRERLPAVLEQLGEPLTPAGAAFLRDVPDLNASPHGDVEAYYDPGLRTDINQRDELVFDLRLTLL